MPEALFYENLVEAKRVLYTPSSFAKSSLLHIQETGRLQATKPHVSKRSRLDSYLFFIVHSGSGTLKYKGTVYPLKAGQCVFIDCHQAYSHETSKDLWDLSWVHFSGPTVAEIYKKYKERGGLPAFTPVNTIAYEELAEELIQTASGNSHVRDMEINTLLSRLLTLLMKDSWPQEEALPSGHRADLASIHDYLRDNYAKKITLDELAERYYINKFYLARIFKEQYGISINNYLRSVRITHAKQDLRFTNKTMDSIGQDNGIGNGYYFSRIFSEVEGISPSEFRKQWRE